MTLNDRRKILVIDDDEKLLMVTRELLELMGYEVTTRNKSFGATSLIAKMRPDLVLLDVNMPGLSGNQLATLLREDKDTQQTPIVLHSSNDEDSLRVAANKIGAAGYICKGDLLQLRHKVSSVLDKYPGQAHAAI